MALIDSLLAGVISDDQKILIEIIIHESVTAQVDPVLAVSMAILESGLNPQAVGDSYTSFGLYQLHKGGELGDLTESQAFDPVKNTRVALSYLKHYEKPALNPGELAAAAQRPKYPEIYAYTVNLIYPMAKKLMNNLGVYSG